MDQDSRQSGIPTVDLALAGRLAEELASHGNWTRERLLAYQSGALNALLRHAAAHSPYYRETIGKLVSKGRPFAEFPIMTKSKLMADFDRVVADDRLTRKLVEQHVSSDRPGELLLGEYRCIATGGSTGQRGLFVYDRKGWNVTVANQIRTQRMTGITPDMRGLGIGAPSPVHLSYRFHAEFRASRPGAPTLFVTSPVEEIVAALNAYQPDYLNAYPSLIRRLAEEQTAGRLRIAPKLFRSSAEALAPDVRELVKQVWNAPVANGYTATETGIMAVDCEHCSGMHIMEDLVLLEVVDADNRPVPAGTQGSRMLATVLFNYALPVIRYDFSDLITLADGACPCGRPFRRIQDIEGRAEEFLRFRTRSGAVAEIHAARLRFRLVKVEGIRQYQFAALDDGILIRLATEPGRDRATVGSAVKALAARVLQDLGIAGARVELQLVDGIERIGGGAKEKIVG
ncbi:phenylacetate--CoA ligase family protein [Aestuariivirga sp.]|uniref:phenylacetate--CoA ligase family protein n=1 Tax=Aestuariivirga sp. TaxID=2650926 RepID=UPI00391A15D0